MRGACACAATTRRSAASRRIRRWGISRIRCSTRCWAGAMRSWPATLFHELAHQVVYVPGDSEFNEAFATVVEEAGPRALADAHGSAAGAARRGTRSASAGGEFIELLLTARERLRELVRIGSAGRRDARAQAVRVRPAEARVHAAQAAAGTAIAGYDRWFDRTLNNAHLVSAATYYGCVPGLAARAERGRRRPAALLRRRVREARGSGSSRRGCGMTLMLQRPARTLRGRCGVSQPIGNTSVELPRRIVIANAFAFLHRRAQLLEVRDAHRGRRRG